MAEAREFARAIVARDTAHGSGTFKVMHARYGQLNRLRWTAEFPDLAALETWQEWLRTDEESQALVSQGLPLFVDGSIHDELFELL